ncbi:MAG TPA: DNA methyltransferase [Nocardioidaceae bacterium]|nr:DNA methyltransferase [Nocardioidaceae bacterium]
MRSGEEIQAALRAFVARWADFSGSEKAEAQTFLNELVDCYGLDRQAAGMLFEHFVPGAGFMDMFWPGRALVEMKAPSKTARLEDAQPQAERYWRASEDPAGTYDAVRYVVLCSFHRILVWDMRRPSRPAANLTLDELPDHYEALGFLLGEGQEASFVEHHRALTLDAAAAVSTLYHSLKDRDAAPADVLIRFVMQIVWTLFAEDLQMLRGYPLQTIVDRLMREAHPNSARDIGFLFRVLDQKGAHNRTGELAGTAYVNGQLFAEAAEVDLNSAELALLSKAATFDWRRVDPTIFGSLMEGVLGRDRRWEVGAHYTHEVDILKIVEPTIVRPWQERIDACTSPQQARDLLDELCAFKVLDPACGCGNFLYVAYRELRSLEAQLKARIRALAESTGQPVPAGPWPYVPLTNLQGIDIEGTAVLIARVVLWMGHRQMIELYGEAEPPLPLVALDGVRRDDALRTPWPETDCIIGNPPFLGDKHLRQAFGADYVEWLEAEFEIGLKDFCVYWFRRSQDHLFPGQRAGLVGTNSVSQNRSRSASLQYILDSGGVIVDAVSSQKWPGNAKVHVSLVNWVKSPLTSPARFVLDGRSVQAIGADLRPSSGHGWAARPISENADRCFIGVSMHGDGFLVPESWAEQHEELYKAGIVKRFLDGRDIVNGPTSEASRWVIDFDQKSLEAASGHPEALAHVKAHVRPVRESNRRPLYRQRWWLFGEPRPGMRRATAGLRRMVVSTRVGKRLILTWQPAQIAASDATVVFAFDDDYSMGLLQSRPHAAWAWAQASTLKGDLRYTPSSVFMTFPWPYPTTPEQREAVAEACRRLLARRTEICAQEQIGLTKLYNAVDEGAWADLKALHRELDVAVAACYGWPASVAQDDAELVARLTELNREISAGVRPYDPFAHLDRPTAS